MYVQLYVHTITEWWCGWWLLAICIGGVENSLLRKIALPCTLHFANTYHVSAPLITLALCLSVCMYVGLHGCLNACIFGCIFRCNSLDVYWMYACVRM